MPKKNKKMPKGAPPPADAPQPQMMQMPHPSQNPNFASIWTVDGSQEADFSKWYVIYPNYINADKSLHLGRRIPIERACRDPICAEIADVCRHLKLSHAIEHYKCYSRDWMNRGRVRVQLKKEDGTPFNEEVPTKKALLFKCAELIPKSASRAQRVAHMEHMQQQQQQAITAAQAGKTGKTGKSKKKKKGKR